MSRLTINKILCPVDFTDCSRRAFYIGLGEYELAESSFLRVVDLLRDNPSSHFNLAMARYRQGRYAEANHACIHRHVAENLGVPVLYDLENHHNFAWRERHDGEDVIVHRKGATPASEGVLGIIPGSMATGCYIVEGKGNPQSYTSASHGAGRVMSRNRAKKELTEANLRQWEQRYDVEYRITRPDGEVRWIWSRAISAPPAGSA